MKKNRLLENVAFFLIMFLIAADKGDETPVAEQSFDYNAHAQLDFYENLVIDFSHQATHTQP